MAGSVHITTPIPTLEEFGKSLGISKSRQASLIRLVKRNNTSGRFVERTRDSIKSSGELRKKVGDEED